MKYCYMTMKTTAIENPDRMKISVEEFIERFDIWSIFTDSPDDLEEIVIGLMDGLTDDQIKVYANRFITKKEMIALRTMLTNGVPIRKVNGARFGFECANRKSLKEAMGRNNFDALIHKHEVLNAKRNLR